MFRLFGALMLLLMLSQCSVCRFNPNFHLEKQQMDVKDNPDVKQPSILSQLQDYKDRMVPGGQFQCKF